MSEEDHIGKWGPAYGSPGFFPQPGRSEYPHFFGGKDWRIEGVRGEEPPVLLLDLDLTDPLLLSRIESGAAPPERLPVVSLINSTEWESRQEYVFCRGSGTVRWISPAVIRDLCDTEDRLPNPLRRERLTLTPMRITDCPTDEDNYWEIAEAFLGGSKFIRILGSPYWLRNPVTEFCACGGEMHPVVAIGYEAWDGTGMFSPQAFFIGEAALYFFVCWECRRVHVLSQPA